MNTADIAALTAAADARDAKLAAQQGRIDAIRAALISAEVAERERDDLRWQLSLAGSYGGYMRHCIRPITFAEWVERRRAMLESLAQVQP